MQDENKNSSIVPKPRDWKSHDDLVVPSLRDVATILFRRKRMILAVLVILSFGVVGYALMLPNVYSSEALLLIKEQRGGLAFDPAAQSLVTAKSGSTSRSVSTEMSILKSVDLAESVVARLGIERVRELLTVPGAVEGEGLEESASIRTLDEEDLNKHAVGLIQNSIQTRGNGSTIEVSYFDAEPRRAQAILHTVIDTYLDKHLEVHGSSASPEFFEKRVNDVRAEIALKTQELEQIEATEGIRDITSERAIALQQLADLDTKHSALRAQIEGVRATIRSQEEMAESLSESSSLDDLASAVPGNSELSRLRSLLFELELKEIDLSSRYVDNKELRSVREQIAATKDRIQSLTTVPGGPNGEGGRNGGLGAFGQDERLKLVALEAEEASLLESRAEISAHLDKLDAHGKGITAREHELADLQATLAGLKRGYDQAKIDAELDRDKVSNVNVLQAPTLSMQPVAPRRKRMILFGIFVAGLAAVSLAFVREYLDDTVKSANDLSRKVGMDLLVSVSESEYRRCT